MFNYKKAINEGMRAAIRHILIEIQDSGVLRNEVYIKFKLEQNHFRQIPKLIPDYADFFTIELSKNNYKNLIVHDSYFEIEIPTDILYDSGDFIKNSKFTNVTVNFASVTHFIDTEQNVSIEIEDAEDEETKIEKQETARRKIN